jgi:S-adenosylmethionine:tRNA ribosyltransferase-isomerase
VDVNKFDFILPESLIAQSPLKDRAGSRLLSLNKKSKKIDHHVFTDFIDFLNKGDTLVLNDTKVIPARLFGVKKDTGAKAEILLLKSLGEDRWEVLVKPAKKLKVGSVIEFGANASSDSCLMSAEIESESDMGGRVLKFRYVGIFNELLDQLGQMPLPPYIKQQLQEKDRYQTVYAKNEGSAAAPTAGLHFTNSYLQEIERKGITITYVTLHVGLGTFRPVSVERVEDHEMHEEYYHLSEETAEAINHSRSIGGKVIAVGTTSARTLETVAQLQLKESSRNGADSDLKSLQRIRSCSGWTNIFMYPGYSFLMVDALLTNFHLPKSTLMMLISALADRDTILRAYQEAIDKEYRFFSFGDAMYIY